MGVINGVTEASKISGKKFSVNCWEKKSVLVSHFTKETQPKFQIHPNSMIKLFPLTPAAKTIKHRM